MTKLAILPIAMLALAACSDTSTDPPPLVLDTSKPAFHHSTVIQGLTVTPGNGSVSATWTASFINNSESGQYVVELRQGSTLVEKVNTGSTRSYSKSGLAAGSYSLRVTGHDGSGNNKHEEPKWTSSGNFTVTATPIKSTQSVTITAPLSVTYGVHALSVSASATSEQPVSLSASGPCTLSSSGSPASLTINGAGTCELTASQAGSSTWEAASTTIYIAIAKAPLTVAAEDKSKTYDGQPFSAFTATYSGFVNGENASALGGALEFSGSAIGAKDAGTYSILPGGLTSLNYAISFTAGAVTISKAPLTVAAEGKSKTYDGQPFSGFTATYSGFVNGENASALGGALEFSGSAIGAKNAGTYSIVPGGLTSLNYAISFTAGTLTISKAPLTISVSPAIAEIYYGEPLPSFSTTYSGFVNGEDASVLAAGALSPMVTSVGTHTVTADGFISPNYEISYVPAKLVIRAWTLRGFYSPVSMDKINVVRAGSTVPLKFNVFARAEISDVAMVSSFTTAGVSCTNTSENEVEGSTTGNTVLRYDATGAQFVQNWQTPKVTGCYRATITTADGTRLSALFQVR